MKQHHSASFNQFIPVCYKVKLSGQTDEKAIYILGSLHNRFKPSSSEQIKSDMEKFIYSIRPEHVYFEIDHRSMSYLYSWHNPYKRKNRVEFYIHRAAARIGSDFSGLESPYYQIFVMGKAYFEIFGYSFSFNKDQQAFKKNLFSLSLLLSMLRAISRIIETCVTIALPLILIHYYIGKSMIANITGMVSWLIYLMRHTTDAYVNAYAYNYEFSNKRSSLDVRHEYWLKRVIEPILEGNTAIKLDNTFYYKVLAYVFPVIEEDTLLYKIKSWFAYLNFFPALSRGLLEFFSINTKQYYKSPRRCLCSKDDPAAPLENHYLDYVQLNQENYLRTNKKLLSYEDFVKEMRTIHPVIHGEAERKLFNDANETFECIALPAQTSHLFVVGAAHLIAPCSIGGSLGGGLIDKLGAVANESGEKKYSIEAVDMLKDFLKKAPVDNTAPLPMKPWTC